MRAWAVFFTLAIILIIGVITWAGMDAVLAAARFQALEAVGHPLEGAMDSLRKAHAALQPEGPADARVGIEEAARRLDEVRSRLTLGSALGGRVRARLRMNLFWAALVCLAAILALWAGLYRLFMRPLSAIIRALPSAAAEGRRVELPKGGLREVRELRTALEAMMDEIRSSHGKIRSLERMNIARFMAHQIRNSLTPIRLCAWNLKPFAADPEAAANLDMVVQGTDKIERLIDQFRILSQFPALNRSRVEPAELAARVIRQYPGASLEVQEGAPPVEADPVLLAEALDNVLRNAVESGSAEPPRVEVAAGPPPSITVRDSGSGMDAEVLGRIFDEDYTTKQKGMGIGMAFVKRVLDSHGYGILVESVPGSGTSVTFILESRRG